MRIGYPCVNVMLGCRSNRHFRLTSYSERRVVDTVRENLDCLLEILRFNADHDIRFFRISSDLVPFASHSVCQFDWVSRFRREMEKVGEAVDAYNMRISMHPGQFAVLNSPDGGVLDSTMRELLYHSRLLAAMGLDPSAKIQVHVGGVYGDKEKSLLRFIERYRRLPAELRQRLVLENDDRSYTVRDCLRVHGHTGVPVLLDALHHELNGSGDTLVEAVALCAATWRQVDGPLMLDYSQRAGSGRRGGHASTVDVDRFERFLESTLPFDFDLMLEIKDKEQSVLKVGPIVARDPRFQRA